mmetsp:Transcript_126090/g.223292  ORF Transcript_126090/g.223292 Transcript_126090/m.223292 type:complete len:374 (-) Transcript_126090:28-1149(-)
MREAAVLLAWMACRGYGQEIHLQTSRENPPSSRELQSGKLSNMLDEAHSPAGMTWSNQLAIFRDAVSPLRRLALIFLALSTVPATRLAPMSVPNFRDLGQTPCAHGFIRPGLLLRSASPSNISERDATTFGSSIHTVLDLRLQKDAEKDEGPRRLAPMTRHLPLLCEAKMKSALKRRATKKPVLFSKLLALSILKKLSPSKRLQRYFEEARERRLCKMLDTVSLSDIYEFIIMESQDELVNAFKLCTSEVALPVLVHCTHGKDRTGVFVALVLAACGVSEDDIVEDYVTSHEWGCSLEARAEMHRSFPERLRRHIRADLLDEWCEAPEEQMREFFRRTERRYGSMTAYLDSIGVDEVLRKRVAAQLTQQNKNV